MELDGLCSFGFYRKVMGMAAEVEEKKKHPGGRPTKYREEYVEQAYKYCLLGADDKKLATLFDVDEVTVNNWKKEHPEFFQSIKKGKEVADAEVAHSLYHRAKGFENDEVQVFQYQGSPVVVPIRKYYAPDTGAAMAWLKNRQPAKWRDKQDIEVTGLNGGPIEIEHVASLSDGDLQRVIDIIEQGRITGEVVDITSDDSDKDS